MSERNYWTQLQRPRISRRSMLGASARAGVGAAGLALVGCGDDDDDGASVADASADAQTDAQAEAQADAQADQAEAQAEEEQAPEQTGVVQPAGYAAVPEAVYGGTLEMHDFGVTDVYDPAVSIAVQDMFKGGITYDYMTRLNGLDLVIEGHMADLPEVVDELTYVYSIKPGIRWQDRPPLNGRPFTAEDAAFGWSRFGFDNPEYLQASKVRAVDKWEPIDERTLRVVSKEPFAPLVALLSGDFMLMVSREAHEEFGPDGMKQFENMVGTGAFMPDSIEVGVRSRVVRNPDYWQTGKPYLDALETIFIADAPQREASILTGQIDVNTGWGSDSSIQNNEIFSEEIPGLHIFEEPLAAFWHITFNSADKFADVRLRRAFQLAADRAANITAYRGNHWVMGPVPRYVGALAWGPDILETLPGYRADKTEDIAEAKRLLDAAGYGDNGQKLDFTFRGAGLTHDVLQQNWQALGNIEVTQSPYTSPELATIQQGGDFDITGGSFPGGSEADDFLYGWSHTLGTQNYGHFSDPEVDALAEKQRTQFDFEERKETSDELQQLLLEKSPQLYMHSWVFFQYTQPWVKNWIPVTGGQVWPVADVWLDGKPA